MCPKLFPCCTILSSQAFWDTEPDGIEVSITGMLAGMAEGKRALWLLYQQLHHA